MAQGWYTLKPTRKDMCSKAITLLLDFDKAFLTPKLSSQDAYYSPRLRTYNLGIFCGKDDHIHCFMYDESLGSTGPNEVISFLDYLLTKLERKFGKYDHLIVWSDTAPGQFKECFLFFYLDHLVRRGQFLRIDFKFLLEGHTYSYCDRQFGVIQSLFQRQEVVDIPRKWAKVLEQGNLSNVEVHWLSLEMIKDFKSFLRLQYVSRTEELDGEKIEVRSFVWLNFGYGEKVDENGQLHLVHHPESVFVRLAIDPKQLPKRVSFRKKKQRIELRPELLKTLTMQRIEPVRDQVKRSCVKLARKYLSQHAIRLYESLPSIDEQEEHE